MRFTLACSRRSVSSFKAAYIDWELREERASFPKSRSFLRSPRSPFVHPPKRTASYMQNWAHVKVFPTFIYIFTVTFHPHNHAVKSIIVKNFQLLQNDPDTGRILSQPPLISFKRDKNIGNFLVRSAFQTSDQPRTFKCALARCKTCPFIRNVEKILGPKRSTKFTDHFTCTLASVIYCITYTLYKKLYIGETGRRLSDQFREHLRNVEKD